MSRLRALRRATVLGLTLAEELLRFAWLRFRRGPALTLGERALWMSDGSAHILRRLGFALEQRGARPTAGLIVSNHLSHLDILFYAAAAPCVFLSKDEVRRWPVIGLLARCGGTLFVARERVPSAAQAVARVRHALESGVAVLVFPEATSTDGSTVMPFRPMVFEAAVQAGAAVSAAAIGYQAPNAEERDLCYFGERSFAPHLLACLGLSTVTARISWPAQSGHYECRKVAARQTHATIVAARLWQEREALQGSLGEELLMAR